MAQHMDKNSQVEDFKLRSKRLVIPFSIVHNATPASKTNSNDLPSSMVLSLEGQTATATAIDSGTNFTTEVDANGIFGILLYNLGTVSKLCKYTADFTSAGTIALTAKGASSSGVTASSNIAVSADWTGNLATTDLSGVLTVDYQVSKA